MLLRFLFLTLLSSCGGVKFPSHNAISNSNGDSLRVEEYSTLNCNYIKWKQESINKIDWYVGYKGVTTKFFTYHFDDKRKEQPNLPSAFFSVDESRSEENGVRMMLLDDREDSVNICCKVEAIRDSGYGSIRKVEKEKCIPMAVVEGPPAAAVVRLRIDQSSAQPDQSVNFHCQVDYHLPVTIKIFANRDEVAVKRNTNELNSNLTASYALFRQGVPDTFSVRCLAFADDNTEIGKSESHSIEKARASYNSYTTQRTQYNQYDQHDQQPRKGRFYADAQAHQSHGNVPCHSYIVVTDLSSPYNKKTEIGGVLSDTVRSIFPHVQPAGDTYILNESPTQVLNVLGYNGYRVVGMAYDQREGRMGWTLERKYFEFHRNEL